LKAHIFSWKLLVGSWWLATFSISPHSLNFLHHPLFSIDYFRFGGKVGILIGKLKYVAQDFILFA
jgi:hypothetical protein